MASCKSRFPGVLAMDNVSFSARAGEITGYLGPNGSGK
jgi:ABC-2 type transport system ATP-binding protein